MANFSSKKVYQASLLNNIDTVNQKQKQMIGGSSETSNPASTQQPIKRPEVNVRGDLLANLARVSEKQYQRIQNSQ